MPFFFLRFSQLLARNIDFLSDTYDVVDEAYPTVMCI